MCSVFIAILSNFDLCFPSIHCNNHWTNLTTEPSTFPGTHKERMVVIRKICDVISWKSKHSHCFINTTPKIQLQLREQTNSSQPNPPRKWWVPSLLRYQTLLENGGYLLFWGTKPFSSINRFSTPRYRYKDRYTNNCFLLFSHILGSFWSDTGISIDGRIYENMEQYKIIQNSEWMMRKYCHTLSYYVIRIHTT